MIRRQGTALFTHKLSESCESSCHWQAGNNSSWSLVVGLPLSAVINLWEIFLLPACIRLCTDQRPCVPFISVSSYPQSPWRAVSAPDVSIELIGQWPEQTAASRALHHQSPLLFLSAQLRERAGWPWLQSGPQLALLRFSKLTFVYRWSQIRQGSPTFPKYHASKRSLNRDSKMFTDVLPKGLPQAAGRILITCAICFHCLGEARCRHQRIFNRLSVSCLGRGRRTLLGQTFEFDPIHLCQEKANRNPMGEFFFFSKGGVPLV